MRQFIEHNHQTIEWLLGAFTVLGAVVAWVGNRQFDQGLVIYDVFPPLGLIAFGLMWTHFVSGALRRYSGAPRRDHSPYMTISMGVVLALLILHPGLLWLGLYWDGFGLPPASYLTAYRSQLLAVLLGSLGLMIFLAFELKRWFGRTRWWRYVELAQVVGMVVIFIHALNLGGEVRTPWYSIVWLFYGITFMCAVMYTWAYRKRKEIE